MVRLKLGVVIPVLRNYEGAIKALQSLKTTYDWEPFIVPQWKLNLPLARAWNLGIEKALKKCDFALVINDDILFSPSTVDNLLKRYALSEDKILMVTGDNLRGRIEAEYIAQCFYEDTGINAFDDLADESPDFSCFLLSQKTINKVGWFDENFDPAYHEDNDYHYRIRLAGGHAYRLESAPYYHHGSVTHHMMCAEQGSGERAKLFEKCREYYVSKWGGTPGNEIFKFPYGNPDNSIGYWK